MLTFLARGRPPSLQRQPGRLFELQPKPRDTLFDTLRQPFDPTTAIALAVALRRNKTIQRALITGSVSASPLLQWGLNEAARIHHDSCRCSVRAVAAAWRTASDAGDWVHERAVA